ncbi:MAG: hypothetical protein WCI78_15535 [Mycobacterium sp.]
MSERGSERVLDGVKAVADQIREQGHQGFEIHSSTAPGRRGR